MKVILHFGPGKTGSSSIQKSFIDNESYLSQYGINSLPFLRSADGHHHELCKKLKYLSLDSLQQLNIDIKISLDEQRFRGIKYLFITSDDLCNVGIDKINWLSDVINSSHCQLSSVFMIRNLYEIALSTVQQQIKNGLFYKSLYEYRPYTYLKSLILANSATNTNLHLLSYSENKQNNLFYEFLLKTTGIELDRDALVNKQVNLRLSPFKVRLLNYFNSFYSYPYNEGAQFIEIIRWAIMNIDEHDYSLSISNEECCYLKEHFDYDRSLIKDLYPEIARNPILDEAYGDSPFSSGLGINSDMLSTPTLNDIESVFFVIAKYGNHPDFKQYFNLR